MTLPYPEDRRRERTEKGSQPFKDAKEAMTQKDAKLQSEAEEFGERNLRESDEERNERLKREGQDVLSAAQAKLDSEQ